MTEEMVRLLTDEYAAKILMATYGRERDALSLSRELEIPIAACYRRIHALEKNGLLECTGEKMGRQGKKIKFYRSTLKNARIEFVNGRLVARLQFVNGEKREIAVSRPAT